MKTLDSFYKLIKNKKVGVIGLGISNSPLVDLLCEGGAIVIGRDKKPRDKFDFEFITSLENKNVTLILGDGYLENIDEDIIIKAPGIRRDIPELAAAQKRGTLLTSEIGLFFKYSSCRKFALTGSDGKTTTTTLTYLMLKEQYKNSPDINIHVGGNIGKPLFSEIKNISENDIAVLELSSFQLHAADVIPDSAAITNISPNHLDWHTDYNEYILSKEKIFSFMEHGKIVLNYKNQICRDMAEKIPGGVELRYFSPEGICDIPEGITAIYLKDGEIRCRDKNSNDIFIMNTSDILLPGEHNIENYMCAIAELYGEVDLSVFKKIAQSFGGVEHRIELVRNFNGVKYYNSSIDSSPSRTIAALGSFKDKKVIAIMGGYDKNIPYDVIGIPVCEHTKAVILTGTTAPKIKKAILSCNSAIKPEIIEIDDFAKAVTHAKDIAKSEDIVILTPASASFDKFKNFEERGNLFKDIVKSF